MVEQGASVYGVLLSLQKIDQIGHHGNLVAFDFLQGGDRFLALSVMRESVIAAVESKSPLAKPLTQVMARVESVWRARAMISIMALSCSAVPLPGLGSSTGLWAWAD